MRRRNPFPGVSRAKDRHGKVRWRLKRRIKGRQVDTYLPGLYGSVEFRAAYEAALEGARTTTPRAQAGTFAYLIESYLASAAFRSLAASTRADTRGRLDWIKRKIGHGKYATIEPRHVASLMEKKGGPSTANRLRKDLGQLFRFAAKMHGFKGQNVASLSDPHKTKRDGYHTWTDDEIATYRDKFPTTTKARLAFELLLCTGASRQDAAALTRANIRGGRIFYRRGKTGQEVDLPILAELAQELSCLSRDRMVLIARDDGLKGYTTESFGNLFRRWCRKAGLPHCSSHGLRKAGARRLAEAGTTEFEVMAFLAHRSARESSRYVAAANRAELTTSGMAKLADETRTKLPTPPERLGKVV